MVPTISYASAAIRGARASASLKLVRERVQRRVNAHHPRRTRLGLIDLTPRLHVESGSIVAAVETCDRLRCGCSVAAARPPPLLRSKPYRPSLPARDRSERRRARPEVRDSPPDGDPGSPPVGAS